jgi:tetratricopeptide (TPR) repeat protein
MSARRSIGATTCPPGCVPVRPSPLFWFWFIVTDDYSGHGRLTQGWGFVGEGIDAYLTSLYGSSWLDLLRARDQKNGVGSKTTYSRIDPHCGLRMLTEPVDGVGRLARNQALLAKEVRRDRDRWAHFTPFSASSIDASLRQMGQLLDDLGQPECRDRVWRLRDDDGATRADAPSRAPDPGHPTKGGFLSQWEQEWLRDANLWGLTAEQRRALMMTMRLRASRERKRAQRQAAEWETLEALRRAAGGGDVHAMKTLADLLSIRGELQEAEHWYLQAGSGGDVAAGGRLGLLLMRRGESHDAERWLRWAGEGNDLNAMKDLAMLLWKRGAREEAQTWSRAYVRAMLGLSGGDAPFISAEFRDKVDQGLDTVLDNLGDSRAGRFLRKTRDKYVPRATDNAHDTSAPTSTATPTSPQPPPQRGPDHGTVDHVTDPRSSVGQMEALQPWQIEFDRAENSLRPAAESDADAMVALGGLLERPKLRPDDNGTWDASELEQRTRDRQAKELYRRAIAGEQHPGAMAALGALHDALGEYEEAKRWYIEAKAAGDPSARTGLGVLLLREEDSRAEGKQLLQESAQLGDRKAKTALGFLAWKLDETDEALKWFRDAADAGDALGMLGLARVLRDELNETEEAAVWCRRAIASADDFNGRDRVDLTRAAMHALGEISRSQGNLEAAESWLFWAAVLGDLDAMVELADILQAHGAVAEAERWRAHPGLHETFVEFESFEPR